MLKLNAVSRIIGSICHCRNLNVIDVYVSTDGKTHLSFVFVITTTDSIIVTTTATVTAITTAITTMTATTTTTTTAITTATATTTAITTATIIMSATTIAIATTTDYDSDDGCDYDYKINCF